MGRTPTTRWQVAGYRLVSRRIAHALARGDDPLVTDPLRSLNRVLLAAVVIGALGLGGAAVAAAVWPSPNLADHRTVVGRSSGALFVQLDGRWHPVLNLASARLVIGAPDDPARVPDAVIEAAERGPLLGIPGAPSVLPDGQARSWALCDADGRTTILARSATETEALQGDWLASYHGTDYLVSGGARRRVDLRDEALTRAFGLSGKPVGALSAALFHVLPEQPPLAAPALNALVTGALDSASGRTVGSVVRVRGSGSEQDFLVVPGGLQPIAPTVAQLTFGRHSFGRTEIEDVAPEEANRLPKRTEVAGLDALPTAPFTVAEHQPEAACLRWTRDGAGGVVQTGTADALPMPQGERPVTLAQADGDGPAVDAAWIEPGAAGWITAAGLAEGVQRQGPRWLISDTGVRFGLPEAPDDAAALGGAPVTPAPWAMVSLLPTGPALTRDGALMAHDGALGTATDAPQPDGAATPDAAAAHSRPVG